jgi:hypothetical protein
MRSVRPTTSSCSTAAVRCCSPVAPGPVHTGGALRLASAAHAARPAKRSATPVPVQSWRRCGPRRRTGPVTAAWLPGGDPADDVPSVELGADRAAQAVASALDLPVAEAGEHAIDRVVERHVSESRPACRPPRASGTSAARSRKRLPALTRRSPRRTGSRGSGAVDGAVVTRGRGRHTVDRRSTGTRAQSLARRGRARRLAEANQAAERSLAVGAACRGGPGHRLACAAARMA